jgi:hypothetical protein
VCCILPDMRCGHCGFSGDLSQKSFATIKTEGYVSPNDFIDSQAHWHAKVMQCPGCEKLTLYTYREWHDQDPEDWPGWILYPQSPDVRDLPDKVRKLYEKALPAKTSNPAHFVVELGNILDIICTEQSISKKDLEYTPRCSRRHGRPLERITQSWSAWR